MYDIIIVGAGPSGMTAALYAKQARKNVEDSVLEQEIQIEKDCMTYAQYFTLRTIIGNELESLPKNDEMKKRIEFVLCVLVDEDMSEINEADREKLKKNNAAIFLKDITSKTAMVSLLATLSTTLGLVTPVASIIAAVGAVVSTTALSWLKPWNVKEVKKKK